MAIESQLGAPRAKLTQNDGESEGDIYYKGNGEYKRRFFEEEGDEEDEDDLDEGNKDDNEEEELLTKESFKTLLVKNFVQNISKYLQEEKGGHILVQEEERNTSLDRYPSPSMSEKSISHPSMSESSGSYPALSVSERDFNMQDDDYYIQQSSSKNSFDHQSKSRIASDGNVEKMGRQGEGTPSRTSTITMPSLSKAFSFRSPESVVGIYFDDSDDDIDHFAAKNLQKKKAKKRTANRSISLRVRSPETVQGVRFDDEVAEDVDDSKAEKLTRDEGATRNFSMEQMVLERDTEPEMMTPVTGFKVRQDNVIGAVEGLDHPKFPRPPFDEDVYLQEGECDITTNNMKSVISKEEASLFDQGLCIGQSSAEMKDATEIDNILEATVADDAITKDLSSSGTTVSSATDTTSNNPEKTVLEMNSVGGVQQQLLAMPQSVSITRNNDLESRHFSGQIMGVLTSKSDASVRVQVMTPEKSIELTVSAAFHEASVKQVLSSTVPSDDDDDKDADGNCDVRLQGFRRILGHLVCGCQ